MWTGSPCLTRTEREDQRTLIMSIKVQSLTILSWNVNGFTQKKSNIFHYLKLLQADVVFLQETHIGPTADCPAGSTQIQGLDPDYDWAVFSIFKNSCRGVAVLFRKGLGCEGLRVVGDDKGRYVIISCKIQEKEFEFVNVYNPTDERIDFEQFRDTLFPTSEATFVVIGGDFNTVMDAEVDKTSNIRNRGHKVRFTGLMGFLDTFDLEDIWRWLYPEEKSFTYFDVKGKSRLDYFFLPRRNLTSVNACKIHTRPHLDGQGYISDHAPISLQIQTKGQRKQFYSGFLRDKDTMEQLSNIITSFSQLNRSRKGDLWPALKTRVICEIDFENSGNDLKFPRCFAKIHISRVLDEKQPVEQKGLLSLSSHDQITHPGHYFSEVSNQEEYLDYLYETKMFEDIELTLNVILTEPVSKKEILSAIFSLHPSEHLTPDGLSVSFYKHFACKMTDLLQAFFNQILDLQNIKGVFNEYFTLEPFPTASWDFDNADHTYCVQYNNPITIFNTDYNILASILADRLNSIMGYILKRGNIRSLLSVQDYINAFERIKTEQLPVLAISVKVDPSALKWPYLFHRLKALKLPCRFRAVVRSLVQTAHRSTRGLKVHQIGPPLPSELP
ncbi:LINE-1 retrotransposable element ORF2 protein isoform X2 [Brachyhypopomus gauderio]|uniref:LINE-1 retrotransposable element ORF2 protein isoform X2 n=1 Tax=Brachyhypopomus gauderio TaxID=698409 RepID=UPI0040438345